MPEMSELIERRDELDAALADVGEAMARSDEFDLASSTLSTRLGKWERGEREPDDGDLAALVAVYDAIEKEQNHEYPECVVCGRTPECKPDETPAGPTCIACNYGADGEEGY